MSEEKKHEQRDDNQVFPGDYPDQIDDLDPVDRPIDIWVDYRNGLISEDDARKLISTFKKSF